MVIIGCKSDEDNYVQYKPEMNIYNWAAKPILNRKSLDSIFTTCLNGQTLGSLCQNVYYRANKGQFKKQLIEQIDSDNDFIVSLSIYASGKGGVKLPEHLVNHHSSIVRQYFATHLKHNHLKNSSDLLKQMKEVENNSYVLRNIESSLNQINGIVEPWRFTVSKFDSLNEDYTYQLYNSSPDISGGIWGQLEDTTTHLIYANTIVKPTIAFDNDLPNSPSQPNFLFSTDGEYFHVGEDNTWDWQGIPAHAMADSKVKYISYDSSWGVFIVLETVFKNNPFTYYYGHLKNELLVSIGDSVKKGQVIGYVGEPTSIENGGYRAHIHMGLETKLFKHAEIGGYEFSKKSWISPRLFFDAHTSKFSK